MKTKLLILLSLIAAVSVYAGSATWNLDPTTGDWSTGLNWTPNTVPNGPDDTATFDVSNVTDISIRLATEVEGIVFNAAASAFTISTDNHLTISGTGIANSSGLEQNFHIDPGTGFIPATLQFTGKATAGSGITFTMTGKFSAGRTKFLDDSRAGASTFVNLVGGQTEFLDRSSAGEGIFINLGKGGETVFMGDSTAADGTFVVDTSAAVNGVSFLENSNAGHGNFTLNAPTGGETVGGVLLFSNTASAANGIFTVHESAEVIFGLTSTAGNATLIADGGGFVFQDDSSGGTARVELFDDAILEVNFHDRPGMTIGSVEGNGLVHLGSRNLTVGSNDLSTTFSGIIENGGALNKIGTGTFTLTGANTYQGGTTISGGVLLVSNTSGSGTGTCAVSVNSGTLGGSGIIAGAVTVGTNTGVQAFLAPSKGAKKPVTLTIQGALTLNDDSTYIYQLNTKRAVSDQVIANGAVIDSGAKFSFRPSGNNALMVGQVFTVISDTAATPIAGTFHNLRDGKIIPVNGSKLQASYSGGDGNDLTLTVVP